MSILTQENRKWCVVLPFSGKEYSFVLIILTLLPLSTLDFCDQGVYSTPSGASQVSSIAQARPGYFGSEVLKTERNLHATAVQKKWTLKLNYLSPNGRIKFTAWLCKQITPHGLWWRWVKWKAVLLYDDTNNAPQIAALNTEIFPSETPQEPREQTRFRLQTEPGHELCHDTVRCRTKKWRVPLNAETYAYVHALSSVEIDTAHSPASGLYSTPWLRWYGNEEATSSVHL